MQVIRKASGRSVSASQCAGTLLAGLPDLMWYVRRQMRSRRDRGLSVSQFRTLIILQRCPETPLSAVAEKLDVSLPAVSRMISGLTAKGYVKREACSHDARCMSLELTARGETMLETAWSGTQAALAEKFSDASDADRAAVDRAFELIGELFCRDADAAGCASTPPSKQSRTSRNSRIRRKSSKGISSRD